MYTVLRTRTCKEFSHNAEYYVWDKETKTFETEQDVRDFLKEEYADCKKIPMYQDGKDGTKKTGHIYCFNTPKCSHDDTAKHNQDWVSIYHSVPKNVLL